MLCHKIINNSMQMAGYIPAGVISKSNRSLADNIHRARLQGNTNSRWRRSKRFDK
jgi:hypothetical protein